MHLIVKNLTEYHLTVQYGTTLHLATSTSAHIQKSNCQRSVWAHTTILRYNDVGVIEWILPYNVSQSQILGQFLRSNASTILTAVGAIKLASVMTIPSNMNELSNSFSNFVCTMKGGNLLYDKFNVSPQQPNLEVRNVVENIIFLNNRITILNDEGFFCWKFAEEIGNANKIRQRSYGCTNCATWQSNANFHERWQAGTDE